MEATLTARDKKLLYMLGFIVIAFVFGWIVMRPIIKTINKTNESIASAEALKQQNETKNTGLMSAQILVEKFEEDLATATEEYYEPMDSSEIDKMFTMYVLDFGLRAKDLIISMPTAAEDETPYRYSELGKKLRSQKSSSTSSASSSSTALENTTVTGTTASSAGKGGEGAEETPLMIEITKTPLESYSEKQMLTKNTTAAGITSAEVTIVLTGSVEKTQRFLDDILTKPAIRVTGFSWEDMAPVVYTFEDGSVMVADSRDRQLTIRLKLYMYDSEKAGVEVASKKN